MAKGSLNADYVRTEISRWQARSMAMSTRGIVAAENPLAAQAGAVVLARGGHAVDAAIAAMPRTDFPSPRSRLSNGSVACLRSRSIAAQPPCICRAADRLLPESSFAIRISRERFARLHVTAATRSIAAKSRSESSRAARNRAGLTPRPILRTTRPSGWRR